MKLRSHHALLLALIVAFSSTAVVPAAEPSDVKAAAEKTASYVLKAVPEPTVGSIGGEWAVLALSRGGWDTAPSQSWYDGYLQRAAAALRENGGVLSTTKYTEYSRVVLALAAIGADARSVGGCDLLTPISDRSAVTRQGINGAVWALIAAQALDQCALYDADADGTVVPALDWYQEEVLAAQLPSGGWSLAGREPADADLTAMALTALSPSQGSEARVDSAIEAGLKCLAGLQQEDGSFGTPANAESCAQVVMALSALGKEQSLLTRSGKTPVDALLRFARGDGSFAHTAGGGADQMATEQALCALSGLMRQNAGLSSFYHMGVGGDGGPLQFNPAVHLPAEANLLVSYPDLDSLTKTQREAVEVLTRRGVFTGRGDGSFAPGDSMTRAEFCAVLCRALGLDGNGEKTPFTELPAWCAPYVAPLYNCGIVKGTSLTAFTPNGTITRQEAAVMIARAAQFASMRAVGFSSSCQRSILGRYQDSGRCGQWAAPSLALCLQNGLLGGVEREIRPGDPITRLEIAESVYALLKSPFVQ
ncbi:S-layer homology domain-containing protein [Oscillibacter sp. MSJ-2]|uniref:S-layer homology domain-containing protein n=1 Tax=Dysosmobacter acutus TaxID=2841504 RepID=A0ABS6F6U3_9FIRM|nr:S-layer homology domain-containing protein [Dysosmobacter acutus]MBU5625986.1 S-layer homology domain-containing protein [Dysosmobacter acutus]